jgi:hypothetical protein
MPVPCPSQSAITRRVVSAFIQVGGYSTSIDGADTTQVVALWSQGAVMCRDPGHSSTRDEGMDDPIIPLFFFLQLKGDKNKNQVYPS